MIRHHCNDTMARRRSFVAATNAAALLLMLWPSVLISSVACYTTGWQGAFSPAALLK